MPRLDLTSLRYIGSAISILVGVVLLVYLGLSHTGRSHNAAAVVGATATNEAEVASSSATAVAATATPPPPPPPAAPALVKGTDADCFRGWRFFDNPQERWTVCLPMNMLYFNGKVVTPFESLQPADMPAVYRDFSVVNESWYLAQDIAPSDAAAPLSIKIEVVPPTATLDGCAIRQQAPAPNGTVSCTDRLTFGPTSLQFTPTGSYQRYRSLTPTLPDKKTTESYSLGLTVYSYAANSTLQQRLISIILDSLKPY